jgi:hypothetical protein
VRHGQVWLTVCADVDNRVLNTNLDIYGSKRASKQGNLPKDPKYYIHTSDIADIVSYMLPSKDADCPN